MALPKTNETEKSVTFTYSKGNVPIFSNTFHSFYEVLFFLDGNVEFVCPSFRKALQPLDVVIIPAGEYHKFIVHGNAQDYERCVLTVEASLINDDLLKEAFGSKRILRLDKDDRIIKHLFYLKEANETLSDEDFSMILPAVTTDLVFLIKQTEDAAFFEEKGLQKLSVNIMNYINANYKSKITLYQIAKDLFVSVSSACHYFKADFGVSIKQYIIEKKMNEARILVEKGYKAQDICDMLGFENYSTFFRAYKKYFDCSPSGRK